MSSNINLTTFTKAIFLFCLIVFIYTLLPDSSLILKQGFKFIIFVGIFIIVLLSSKLLNNDALESTYNNAKQSDDRGSSTKIDSSPNELYDKLNSLISSSVLSINPKANTGIYMLDPDAQLFNLQTANNEIFFKTIKPSNQIIHLLLEESKTLHQKDYPEAWDKIFNQNSYRGSECVIGSKINLHNSNIGFILIQFDHFSDLDKKDILFFESLGNFMTQGLENLESLEKYIHGNESKFRLLDLLSDLNIQSDISQILSHFSYLIRTYFQYDRMTISLKNDSGINATIKLVDGIEDENQIDSEFPIYGTLHGLPISTGEMIFEQEWKSSYQNISRFQNNESPSEYKSILGAPIIFDKVAEGSIILEKLSNDPYKESDIQNLNLIGRVLGSILYWIIEYEKIHNDATHDGLSGLLNHQAFKNRIKEDVLRAKRFQHQMAILIFDLDKFKRINDTLGHQYGDYVIKTVSKIMTDNVRAIDAVARYGGEEFAIILVNTSADMAMVVAQRIVDNIAHFPFDMDGEKVNMTISCGMSEYPVHSEQIKDLIEFADQAMYKAKKQGGNSVLIHRNDNDIDENNKI